MAGKRGLKTSNKNRKLRIAYLTADEETKKYLHSEREKEKRLWKTIRRYEIHSTERY